MVLGALASAVQAALPSWPLMIVVRVLEGVSHLAIVVVGPTMIAGLASDAQRPLAMTLWSSFFGVTYAVLALIGPGLVAAGGMAGVFWAHAGWMAVLAGVLAMALPRDPPPMRGRMGPVWAEHLAIYASPRLAAPAMGFCFYTFLYVAVLTLLPPETPAAQRALMATGMPLVSILVSLTLGVRMLRWMSAVRLVQWGYWAAIPGFVALWALWGWGPGMVAAGFWLSGALGIVQGASFACIPELNGSAEDRARASGAVAQLGNLGTTTGTPVLAALLAAGGPLALMVVAVAFSALGVGGARPAGAAASGAFDLTATATQSPRPPMFQTGPYPSRVRTCAAMPERPPLAQVDADRLAGERAASGADGSALTASRPSGSAARPWPCPSCGPRRFRGHRPDTSGPMLRQRRFRPPKAGGQPEGRAEEAEHVLGLILRRWSIHIIFYEYVKSWGCHGRVRAMFAKSGWIRARIALSVGASSGVGPWRNRSSSRCAGRANTTSRAWTWTSRATGWW